MSRRRNIITVAEIIQEIVDMTGKSWNEACDDVEFCKYENSSEDFTIEDVDEFFEDLEVATDIVALQSIMKRENLKEVTIINE